LRGLVNMTQATRTDSKSNTGQDRGLLDDQDEIARYSAAAGADRLVLALQAIVKMGPAKISTRPLTVYQIAMAALGQASPFPPVPTPEGSVAKTIRRLQEE